MKYDNPKLRQMLAGEYVTGTLIGRARARFQRLLESDPGMQAEVRFWESRFVGMGIDKPVTPRAVVWTAIENELRKSATKVASLAPAKAEASGGSSIWKVWSGLATAAAVVLAILLVRQPEPAPPAEPVEKIVQVRIEAFVAALRLPEEEAQWTVSATPETGDLRIASSAAAKLSKDKDYHLWWVADSGVTSLGLLPRTGVSELKLPGNLDVSNGKIAVSLEPSGGSPEPGPTGPVLIALPLQPIA